MDFTGSVSITAGVDSTVLCPTIVIYFVSGFVSPILTFVSSVSGFSSLLLVTVLAESDFSSPGISHGKGEGHVVYASVNCVCNVCGSAHSCGCVVNGTFARAAF